MDVIGVENMIWYHYSTSLLDEMRIYAAEDMAISRSDANVFSVLEVSLVDHNQVWEKSVRNKLYKLGGTTRHHCNAMST